VPPPDRAVVVVGATSLVGRYLLPRLAAAGRAVEAVSRTRHAAAPGARWHAVDVVATPDALPAAGAGVHLAPLWLAPPLVGTLAARGVRRLIAFGSTSRFTKEGSPDAREREVARRLADAEERLEAECARHGVAWTIFRPTLIYGGGLDRSLSAIAAVARRARVVPVSGPGRGLRQPVHADDLAALCVTALDRPAAAGRAYDVGGGSVLSYRAMVDEVCRSAGGARVIGIPAPPLRLLFRATALLPGLRWASPAMVDRMERDLVVDDSDARRDLGWAPRAFAYPDGAPA
jgi:nucleoside-diphosphate-sugar epimerase